MITSLLLLFFGLLFILLEFYMPGGIMAVIGTLLLLVSIGTIAEQTDSLAAVIVFICVEALLLFLLIKYTLRYIPRAKTGISIYLNKDQEGYQASQYDEKAIGKIGVVVTDLKPGGYIFVDGKKQQAISQTGYIPEGDKVKVIDGEAESLIVKVFKEDSSL